MEIEIEVVRGTGDVYRDLGKPNSGPHSLKAKLAAEIIKALDREGVTVRRASELTGIAAADFSRVRNARLQRFTVDRLITMLERLGNHIIFDLTVQPAIPDQRSARTR